MVRNKCSTALSRVWAYQQLFSSWLPSTLWFTWAAAISARAWATVSAYFQCRQSLRVRGTWLTSCVAFRALVLACGKVHKHVPKGKESNCPPFCGNTAGSHWPKQVSATLGLSLLQAQTWVLMRMVFSIKAASIISQHYAPGRGNENQVLLGSHTGEQLTFPVI